MQLSIESFFNYHANHGGKLLEIFVSGRVEAVKLSELKKIQGIFTLPTSTKDYTVITENNRIFVGSN